MGHVARIVVAGVLLVSAAPALARQAPAPLPDEAREQLRERLRLLDPAAQEAAAREAAAEQRPRRTAAPRIAAPAWSGEGQGIPRDAIMEELLRLEGFTFTEYQGSGAHYDADGNVVLLHGPARVLRDGQTLTADSLMRYDLGAALLCGYGQPVLSGADGVEPVESDRVCYDVNRRLGEAYDARTRITEGATWIVYGERTYLVGDDRVYSHSAIFTDCDLDEPHYHFGAREIKLINNDVLVARNVTLNFGDVPVFWLPFMVQSLKEGRRSGLLTPRFGINDIARNQSGYRRRISNVGYYWAINDYLGAEMSVDWFSQNWTALDGQFQYRWAERFLDGSLRLRRFWRETGSTELTLSTSNNWQIDERTTIRVDGNYTSSSDFVRRESRDPYELNRSIDSNAGLNRRFDWGRVSLGASRRQFLSDDRVELTLPNFGLNLAPVTLFGAAPGEARWYNNATWTASTTGRVHRSLQPDTLADRRSTDVSATSNFSLGNLSFRQNARANEQARLPKASGADTTELRANWSTQIDYQQRLLGTSTLTPGVEIRGELVNSPRSGGETLTAPLRINFNTNMRTDVFGFWPGVGPFSAFRHRLSPSITYNYSPAAQADSLQREVFGQADVREQNRISIGLSQTWEAKFRADEEEAEAALDEEESDLSGEPRRLREARPITLLSVHTSAVAYDWVRAREDTLGGRWPGVVTGQLNNSVSSDLLRGLQLSFTHDLFETTRDSAGVISGREFAPHLSSVTASVSLSGDSWLLRLFGLGRGRPAASVDIDPDADGATFLDEGPGAGRGDLDLVGGARRGVLPGRGAPRGPWNASLNYSLTRPRESASGFGASQMLRGSVSFQPTENWAVRWNTGYSFTDREFSDHILTLSRDLHDWQANFDFVRAQNGNFTFQFRVQLLANPDIKLEYEQRSDPLRPGGF